MSDYDRILVALAAVTVVAAAALWTRLAAPGLKAEAVARRRLLATAGAVAGTAAFASTFVAASIAAPAPSLNAAPGLLVPAAAFAVASYMLAMIRAGDAPKQAALCTGVVAVMAADFASLSAGGPSLVVAEPLLAAAASGVAACLAGAALDLAGHGRGASDGAGAIATLAATIATPIGAASLLAAPRAGALVDPLVLVVAAAGLLIVQAGWIASRLGARWLSSGSGQERLALLADAASDGLALCENGRIRLVNRSLARLAGRDPRQLVGRNLATLLFGPGGAGSLTLSDDRRQQGAVWTRNGELVAVEVTARVVEGEARLQSIEVRVAAPTPQAASSADLSAAAARTLRRRMARSAASPVRAS